MAPCPVCQHPYLVQKSTKAKGDYMKCPECGHEIHEEAHDKKPAENHTAP